MIFGPFTHRLPLVGLAYGRRTWLASVHGARMTPETGKSEEEGWRRKKRIESCRCWHGYLACIAIWPST